MGHYFSQANVTLWTEFSAAFFLTLFLAIFCWAYSPQRKERFTKEANIPLED
jgi:cbb3-type cytochrome oxidase subunit 3